MRILYHKDIAPEGQVFILPYNDHDRTEVMLILFEEGWYSSKPEHWR